MKMSRTAIVVGLALLATLTQAAELKVRTSSGQHVWSTSSYSPMVGKVGDVLSFKWSGYHNLVKLDTSSCSSLPGQLISNANGAASYTLTAADARNGPEIYFSCSVGSHCQQGQLLKVYVCSEGDDSSTCANNANSTDSNTNTGGYGLYGGRYGSYDSAAFSPSTSLVAVALGASLLLAMCVF